MTFLVLKFAFAVGVVGVSSTAGGAGWGTTNLVNSDHDAVRGDRAARSSQPWICAKVLGRDGHQWLECLLSNPIIAIVPFAIIVAAMRKATPTNLQRTGAFAGLIAGA